MVILEDLYLTRDGKSKAEEKLELALGAARQMEEAMKTAEEKAELADMAT